MFELLVVDADPAGLTAISAGTVEVYGNWSVTWYPDQTGVIDARRRRHAGYGVPLGDIRHHVLQD